MIGIKDMDMPVDCWSCDLTFDDFQGCTRCCFTKEALYPVGQKNDRENNCPLIEIE